MLGENLQKARLAQKLTQEEVAKELYFSRQAISRWESNKTEPNFETLIALAELYESDLSAFAQGIEPQKRKKHINLFAGFGLVFFNFVLGFWLIITTALILLALYAIILALFLAPFIMIFAVATHNPHITFSNANGATGFDWWYWLVAIIACSLMVLVSPLIWRFTKLLYFWLIKYLKFNLKSVYN
ncbi:MULTISPECIES: helix-turn-helix domain-containing protein [Lactococcus]|jgi:transcriptional regulator with XRE-family HTH domain|uniref:helix-turn-helix domain-containing protein n=1 Tax=Lactococcus TaxID=1357 RepID=UPI00024D9092|nr:MULTISPECIES: helix-turn-helix domain-containing protein [Lactococcus]MCA2380691.1 helix-turn-helix domain-containing protein [Lactococcus sp. SK2-659]MCI2093920.1 helix-turn-helix domain-containing protein [Lactococcus lactis]MCI2138825.1 helix-turn-helix domain-containing protein [Lactococcus lactis]MCI2188869.1 helix-turn-helix domain-containing protein [Lactococcus lactis]MDG4957902.1 helix-turn-helix domain-containing protein [Lactococcus lactis]